MRLDNTFEKEIALDYPISIAGKEFTRLIIREVIGFDEEAISQPQFKKNPTSMIATLLSRCVAEVPGADRLPTVEEIKSLPIGIIDSIILELREITLGEDFINYMAFCPNKDCKKPDEGAVLISDLKVKKDYQSKIVTLPRGVMVEGKVCTKVKIKAPTGKTQEIFVKKKESEMDKFGEMNTDLILACTIDIDGQPVTKDIISGMSKKDRKELQDGINKLQGPTGQIEITCKECGEVFKHTVNTLDFLA